MTEQSEGNNTRSSNRSSIAALSEATHAYYDELNNAWIELNQRGHDAQVELSKKLAEVNANRAIAAAHERCGQAQHTYALTQRAVASGGPPEAWHHFKRAQEEYLEASKEISTLEGDRQRRINEAHIEHAETLKQASINVRNRYEAAFRTYLTVYKSIWSELDVNSLDPNTAIELGNNLLTVASNSRFNLGNGQP